MVKKIYLTGTTTLGQSGAGSNANKGGLHIHQSSKTGASSGALVSYPGYNSSIQTLSICINLIETSIIVKIVM